MRTRREEEEEEHQQQQEDDDDADRSESPRLRDELTAREGVDEVVVRHEQHLPY